jgi:hypothetical protein
MNDTQIIISGFLSDLLFRIQYLKLVLNRFNECKTDDFAYNYD